VEGIIHTGRAEPSPCIWAGFSPAHFKKKIKRTKYFSIFVISLRVLFYVVLFNLSLFFHFEKYESGIKIPGFHQNFQKYKKKLKKKKCFCAYDQVSQS